MEIDLAGRTAVVTGGSKGIGLATVRELAACGATVVTGAHAASPPRSRNSRATGAWSYAVDLSDPQGPAQLIAAAGHRVDILVNNVGGARPRPGGFLSITDDEWAPLDPQPHGGGPDHSRGAAVDARGGHRRHRHRQLGQPRPSRPGRMDYSAAKAALADFSKALSKEVGPRGIRVNTVSPGPVATDLWLGAAASPRPSPRRPAPAGDVESRPRPDAHRPVHPPTRWPTWSLRWPAAGRNITGTDFVIDGGLVPTW